MTVTAAVSLMTATACSANPEQKQTTGSTASVSQERALVGVWEWTEGPKYSRFEFFANGNFTEDMKLAEHYGAWSLAGTYKFISPTRLKLDSEGADRIAEVETLTASELRLRMEGKTWVYRRLTASR